LTQQLAGSVRQAMANPGFALVDTPPYFDTEPMHGLSRGRTVFRFNSPRWWRFPALASLGCWLEELLVAALPEEAVGLNYLEFRHEPENYEDPEVDKLHADGSYIRSVTTLSGPTTLYRDEGEDHPVPAGQTLLMTATDRARATGVPCTLHRRPGTGPERVIIVGSFEPRPENSTQVAIYRQVAAESSNNSRRHRHKTRRCRLKDWNR
jgi:hypothetical protein